MKCSNPATIKSRYAAIQEIMKCSNPGDNEVQLCSNPGNENSNKSTGTNGMQQINKQFKSNEINSIQFNKPTALFEERETGQAVMKGKRKGDLYAIAKNIKTEQKSYKAAKHPQVISIFDSWLPHANISSPSGTKTNSATIQCQNLLLPTNISIPQTFSSFPDPSRTQQQRPTINTPTSSQSNTANVTDNTENEIDSSSETLQQHPALTSLESSEENVIGNTRNEIGHTINSIRTSQPQRTHKTTQATPPLNIPETSNEIHLTTISSDTSLSQGQEPFGIAQENPSLPIPGTPESYLNNLDPSTSLPPTAITHSMLTRSRQGIAKPNPKRFTVSYSHAL
ncbi:hypothetical protein SADUNF_Sadunf19G0015000 [Salix dunnii]|uniref:Uncharacterized protein n=1 Tax=Salix dunnii TaxID=1413687 RepID=A0A835J0M3_9ROSI|nr:hypothetical protein SADUNF_Sadunf19G0015000 [Salix dunnii]